MAKELLYLDSRRDLLAVLEQMIAQVKSGDLIAVAWVKAYSNREYSCGWEFSGTTCPNELQAGTLDLQYRMMRSRNDS